MGHLLFAQRGNGLVTPHLFVIFMLSFKVHSQKNNIICSILKKKSGFFWSVVQITDFLQQTYNRLLAHTELGFKRHLYSSFKMSRLTGLIGPRGVGKTTLMLQFIKENTSIIDKSLYFSADSVYFQGTSLLDFVNSLYNLDGKRYFFIDEIHKYDNCIKNSKICMMPSLI